MAKAFVTVGSLLLLFCVFLLNYWLDLRFEDYITGRKMTSVSWLWFNATSETETPKLDDDSQQSRVRRLREWCSSGNHSKWSSPHSKKGGLERCWANHAKKTIYCFVPKAACTTWKTLMIRSSDTFARKFPKWRNITEMNEDIIKKVGFVHTDAKMNSYGLDHLAKYNVSQVKRKFENYFIFLFVREPYDRLLSAYRNKIETDMDLAFRNNFMQGFYYRYGRSKVPDQNNVTFTKFVDYVIYEFERNKGVPNEHWSPCSTLIDPCVLNFNFIGKIETMGKDAPQVFKHLFPNGFNLLETNKSPSLEDIKKYYDKLSLEALKKIRKRFRDDFELYGYDRNLFLEWLL